MAKQANPNPFEDMTKMMEQFKFPGVDMSAFVEGQRKDIEAVVEANRAAYESMQALARKQTEMLTQTMQGIQEAAKSVASAGLVDPAKQAEAVKAACQKALADMTELAAFAHQSHTEAMASITQRANERIQEFTKLLQGK